MLAHGALVNQEIDVYPEYTGTALTAILKDPPDSDPARVLARVRSEYARRFKVEWLDPLGIDNTFAMVVSGADARAKHLENLTDATMVGRSVGARRRIRISAAAGWAGGAGSGVSSAVGREVPRLWISDCSTKRSKGIR